MTEAWAVILAAGEGKRMRSQRAKVLHRFCGQPLIAYPIALARTIGAQGIILVIGHQAHAIRKALGDAPDLCFVEQKEQRGTGHALAVAQDAVPASATELLLLYADVPLLAPETVARLRQHHRKTRAAATVVTFVPPDPTGYGRIVRRGGPRGRVIGIVEERDATPAQRRLREANSGIYCFTPRALWPTLASVSPDNDQGETYLTDVIGLMARARLRVETIRVEEQTEVAGVNDRRQMARLEGVLRERILARLMTDGVTVVDPASTYVDAGVTVGRDSVLYPGVLLEGRTAIGESCVVGAGCQLTDVTLADRVTLRPYCVLAGSGVETGAVLGPFAHLRPGSVVRADAKVGNFVELKKSTVGRRAKVPHLSYVGDATVGEAANIGAGTITCNYDGEQKHQTDVGARAFIGTNSSLVAPLRIGDDAYIGAGSVITTDVPPGALALGRAHQVVKEGWGARRRVRALGQPAPRPAADH